MPELKFDAVTVQLFMSPEKSNASRKFMTGNLQTFCLDLDLYCLGQFDKQINLVITFQKKSNNILINLGFRGIERYPLCLCS